MLSFLMRCLILSLWYLESKCLILLFWRSVTHVKFVVRVNLNLETQQFDRHETFLLWFLLQLLVRFFTVRFELFLTGSARYVQIYTICLEYHHSRLPWDIYFWCKLLLGVMTLLLSSVEFWLSCVWLLRRVLCSPCVFLRLNLNWRILRLLWTGRCIFF